MKTMTKLLTNRLMPITIAHRLSGNIVWMFRIRNGLDYHVRIGDRQWYSWNIQGLHKDTVSITNNNTESSEVMTYKEAVSWIAETLAMASVLAEASFE